MRRQASLHSKRFPQLARRTYHARPSQVDFFLLLTWPCGVVDDEDV
jgi:hypothetical protein